MAIRSFQSLGEGNVGEFTIAYINYFSESGIRLGKIMVNGIPFAKSAKVFPCQNFVLYGNSCYSYTKTSKIHMITTQCRTATSWLQLVIDGYNCINPFDQVPPNCHTVGNICGSKFLWFREFRQFHGFIFLWRTYSNHLVV